MSTETKEVNPETLSQAELALLINTGAVDNVEQAGRKRNPDGTFAGPDKDDTIKNDLSQDPPDDDVDMIVVRQEVDLGDGQGTQVFRGRGTNREEALEDLSEVLIEAQKESSKRIRELRTRLTAVESAPVDAEPDPDEEFVLGQEISTSPTKTLAKLIDKEIARREARVKADTEKWLATQQDFVSRNPDFYACQENAEALVEYLDAYKLDRTVESLEKAYSRLSRRRALLAAKPATSEEQQLDDKEDIQATRTRIGAPATEKSTIVEETTQRKKVASGLPLRGNTIRSNNRTTGPTADELKNLSSEKLQELANKELRESFHSQ